jgi:hypothetical protein
LNAKRDLGVPLALALAVGVEAVNADFASAGLDVEEFAVENEKGWEGAVVVLPQPAPPNTLPLGAGVVLEAPVLVPLPPNAPNADGATGCPAVFWSLFAPLLAGVLPKSEVTPKVNLGVVLFVDSAALDAAGACEAVKPKVDGGCADAGG